jgi:hypothetical protein
LIATISTLAADTGDSMNRKRIVLAVSAILMGVFLLVPASVHAATTKPPQCVVEKVALHGTQPPAVSCLRMAVHGTNLQIVGPVPQGFIPPGCGTDVVLYQDANYYGTMLCLSGRGLYNLTQYPLFCFLWCSGTWNDQMSSFSTGSHWGHYSWDINNGGSWYGFSPNERVPYIGDLWNDQASGVEIDGP